MRNLIISVLVVLCVWMGHRVVVLENYHYASSLNMCNEYANAIDLMKREICLNEKETRTSWVWTLAYGLKIL
jgi:hypothetical protein